MSRTDPPDVAAAGARDAGDDDHGAGDRENRPGPGRPVPVGPGPKLPTFYEVLRRKIAVIRTAQRSFAQAFRKLRIDKTQVRRWLSGEQFPTAERLAQIDALYEWCWHKT